MGQQLTVTGMVLTSMPVGEYDRRITILTRERGRITAFVRGARRPKSSMVAATNPFCFGEFEAYEGRNSYTVVRASIQNYFQEISADLVKTGYGCYFLELASFFSMENSDGSDQLKLLYQTLRALNVKSLDSRLVRCIYELKTLVYYGSYPNFFSCMKCGTKEHLQRFVPEVRGVLCSDCPSGMTGIFLEDSALYALQYIVASPVEKLYTFTVTEEILKTLEQVIRIAMRQCTDREFKSLEFLQGLGI